VLLALSLGYRRIGFAGVDLGATPYFWLEDRPIRGRPVLRSTSCDYNTASTGANRQEGKGVVPNLYEFLERLAQTDPDVAFFTLDPAARSHLTRFLNRNTTSQARA